MATTASQYELQSSKETAYGHQPGHWVLAAMGKRILRPGGAALTRELLASAAIEPSDRVVELAPGLGHTAEAILAHQPRQYWAVDAEPAAVEQMRTVLSGRGNAQIQLGTASATGLEDASADVVIGEAMLTMQSAAEKRAIAAEAARVLAPGGRYAIHELAFVRDDMPEAQKLRLSKELRLSIKVGARPLTPAGWRALLEEAGLEVDAVSYAPMHLLEPARLIADEGPIRVAKFVWNLIRNREARSRVLKMRSVFRANAQHLQAIAVVARRPADNETAGAAASTPDPPLGRA